FGKIAAFYSRQSGLVHRILLCWLVGTTLLSFLNIKNYDLHFAFRGAQKVSRDLLVVHLPSESEAVDEAIKILHDFEVKAIVAPVNKKDAKLFSLHKDVLLVPRKGFKPDKDGILRSVEVAEPVIEALGLKKEEKEHPPTALINFRGGNATFPSIYFYEIKSQKILPSLVKDKIIIINLQDEENEPLQTPVGDLTPAEILATTIDNILLHRFIAPANFAVSAAITFFLTTFIALLVFYFPSNLAILSVFICILLTSSSCFLLFDHFYLWLPLLVFIIQTLLTYLVFINYKLTKKEQLAWQLEKQKVYQDEMDELKKNFLSLFSHDLKTPIAKILAQMDILENSIQDQNKLSDGFNKVRKYSHELNQYVKNILKISQIESNRFNLKKEPCDINLLIRQAVAILAPIAEEKKITLNSHLDTLFSISCDKDLVQQIILNIIENALKYSPANTSIDIYSLEENDFVVVRIQDHGEGIKVDDQARVWEKFSRVNNKTEGTGLGLYLVKYFVEAHNGAVFMDSEENVGTTVTFKLPIS
ncbi:MAG: CHASE2 domain-containing protein, partial [Bdellovibrionales bacterium]|nr:CHASE2 domain-containing protein [Bdellovibrionales bacterium]